MYKIDIIELGVAPFNTNGWQTTKTYYFNKKNKFLCKHTLTWEERFKTYGTSNIVIHKFTRKQSSSIKIMIYHNPRTPSFTSCKDEKEAIDITKKLFNTRWKLPIKKINIPVTGKMIETGMNNNMPDIDKWLKIKQEQIPEFITRQAQETDLSQREVEEKLINHKEIPVYLWNDGLFNLNPKI